MIGGRERTKESAIGGSARIDCCFERGAYIEKVKSNGLRRILRLHVLFLVWKIIVYGKEWVKGFGRRKRGSLEYIKLLRPRS